MLFIYGTLLGVSGHPLAALLDQHGTRIGKGRIRARLYMIDEVDAKGPNTFPGAVPSAWNEDQVHGELWQINNPDVVYPAFDAYENCGPEWPQPNEFLLRPVDVTTDTGAIISAASYLYTWDVGRARLVPSGRFAEHMPDTR
ncbi:MAG: gamma-glutamylcyclotransferase family protein [Pseudomonadota bacterium]